MDRLKQYIKQQKIAYITLYGELKFRNVQREIENLEKLRIWIEDCVRSNTELRPVDVMAAMHDKIFFSVLGNGKRLMAGYCAAYEMYFKMLEVKNKRPNINDEQVINSIIRQIGKVSNFNGF